MSDWVHLPSDPYASVGIKTPRLKASLRAASYQLEESKGEDLIDSTYYTEAVRVQLSREVALLIEGSAARKQPRLGLDIAT